MNTSNGIEENIKNMKFFCENFKLNKNDSE